jgi:hypothetical protein
MPRAHGVRLVALVCLLTLAVSVADEQSTAAAGTGGEQTVAATLPGVGSRIESCTGGAVGLLQNSPTGCDRWAKSGPINVVLLSSGPEGAYQDTITETHPRWRPAQGGWLVARLQTPGCGSAWQASEQQAELRISGGVRRHIKFIRPGCRWRGQSLTVGEAHTDLYDLKRCGGDHMTDLDGARDQLVRSLNAGALVSRVEYRRWNPPGTTFPDGCGHQVSTDGLVAYVWLAD